MTSRFLNDCRSLCCKSVVADDSTTNIDTTTPSAPATTGSTLPSSRITRSPRKPPPGVPSRASSVDRHGRAATSMNLCVERNRTRHHTDQYTVPELIVRRGQEFEVIILLSEELNEDTDEIRLSFAIGNKPQRSKNTLIKVDVVNKLRATEWGATVLSKEGRKIHMKVMSSADAIVGKYTAYVEVLRKDSSGSLRGYKHAKHPHPMYILFNPWCEDDPVYIEDDRHRFEYVLNDTGRIFKGTQHSLTAKPWNFGQFQKICFYGAMYLLEISSLKTSAGGNVIRVVRVLTAMANSYNNDGGILTGNWTGNYEGGKSPMNWNGSVAIMEEYMRTKRAVKFGQCWVYSGLLTTLCRSLGIPMRSVTNYESAHDHDGSMTIDSHLDADAIPLKDLDDSLWNFHVWNEAWFRRIDLPPGNDGWQVLDATPQEESEGIMRCGPAPVNAVREGHVFLNYDTKFVFAEVNADKVSWMVDQAGEMRVIGSDPRSVGVKISTKAVGSNQRHDVTNNYKYREGSKKERDVVQSVAQYSTRKHALRSHYITEEEDVEMQFMGDMKPNGDVLVTLRAKNIATAARTVQVRFFATAKYYTGIPGDDLGEKKESISIQPDEEKKSEWFFASKFFIYKLDEDATVAVYVTAKVHQTKQVFSALETFWAEKPDLHLQVSLNKVQIGSTFKLKMKFKNPLDVVINNGSFHVESPGIEKDVKVTYHRSIKPQETVEQVATLKAAYPGNREIIASFYSKILSGVEGSIRVEIYR